MKRMKKQKLRCDKLFSAGGQFFVFGKHYLQIREERCLFKPTQFQKIVASTVILNTLLSNQLKTESYLTYCAQSVNFS